jgi:hypothetical protein
MIGFDFSKSCDRLGHGVFALRPLAVFGFGHPREYAAFLISPLHNFWLYLGEKTDLVKKKVEEAPGKGYRLNLYLQ